MEPTNTAAVATPDPVKVWWGNALLHGNPLYPGGKADWDRPVALDEVYMGYIRSTVGLGPIAQFLVLSVEDWRVQFRRLAGPNLQLGRQNIGVSQQRAYRMPPLDAARADHAKALEDDFWTEE